MNMFMYPNSMARIRHDLAIDLLVWISSGRHSIGSRIIPYCRLKLANKAP